MWDLQEANFAANLSLLKEYKAEEGHCNVPAVYKKTEAWNVGKNTTWGTQKRESERRAHQTVARIRLQLGSM